MTSAQERYDRTTIILHWVVAGLVLLNWIGGTVQHWWPKDWRHETREIHVLIGISLVVILLVRLAWRLTKGVHFKTPPSLMEWAARLMHIALYLVVLTVLGLGLFAAWNKGGAYLGGLVNITPFGDADKVARKALSIQILDIHELLANTLMWLAGLHAAAALYHHLVRKDGVLLRMWPRKAV